MATSRYFVSGAVQPLFLIVLVLCGAINCDKFHLSVPSDALVGHFVGNWPCNSATDIVFDNTEVIDYFELITGDSLCDLFVRKDLTALSGQQFTISIQHKHFDRLSSFPPVKYTVKVTNSQEPKVFDTNVAQRRDEIRKPQNTVLYYENGNHDVSVVKSRLLSRQRRQQSNSFSPEIPEDKTGILYTITPSQTGGVTFAIKSSDPDILTVDLNGNVRMKDPNGRLDYDRGPRTIVVIVNEMSGASVLTNITLTFRVTGVNDELPTITNKPTPLKAKANPWAKVGDVVYKLTAEDIDQGSNVTFYIEGVNRYFMVDEYTGHVMVKMTLLQDLSQTIKVFARDIAATTTQESTHVELEISTRDLAPQFYLNQYIANVPENSQAGQTFEFDEAPQVKNFQNGTNMFSIINPRTHLPSELFEIVEENSVYKVKTLRGSYDHELNPTYNLLLKAVDSKSLTSSTVTLTISILDVNEFPPFFMIDTYYFKTRESSVASTIVGQVTALDKDTYSSITYSIGDADAPFEVVSEDNTGIIKVKGELDYETAINHRYEFNVIATDDGGSTNTIKSATATVVVELENVNDNPPMFVQDTWVQNVPDNMDQPNITVKLVLNVKAIDKDGDNVNYAFASGDFSIFDLESFTGEITLKPNTAIPVNKHQYLFNVVARDDGSCCSGGSQLASTASVTINIVDAFNTRPKFNCPKAVTVNEGQPIGTSVYTLSATDDSRGEYGVVDYSLQVNLKFKATDYFTINKSTGEISTTQILNRLDQEFSNRENLYITAIATDRGQPPLSDKCTFRLFINDTNNNAPVFPRRKYTESILNTTQTNFHIINVLATDADDGQNAVVTYSLSDVSGYFRIDPSYGGIFLNQTLGGTHTDTFTMTVTAQDIGGMSASATVEISVRSLGPSPVWDQPKYEFTIDEWHSGSVGNITVNSGMVSNRAVTANIWEGAENIFELREIAEGMYTVSVQAGKAYDLVYEKRKQHIIVVRASNQLDTPRNAYTTVVINLRDKNVQSPVFVGIAQNSDSNYIDLAVLENQNIRTLVGSVLALDGDVDTPAFSLVSYSAATSQNQDNFSIDSSSGTIFSNQVFDAESISSYFFHITAQDGAETGIPGKTGRNSGSVTVQITISDMNDNAPSFSNTNFDFSVDESEAIDHVIGKVAVSDKDVSGIYFYFTLKDKSNPANPIPFGIRWTTGEIYVAGKLDYEKVTQYTLVVQVFDGKFVSYSDVTINVQNVNDEAPVFSSSSYTFTNINEGDYSSSRSLLGEVSATDADTDRGANQQLQYSIVYSPSDTLIRSVFEINSTSGQIYVKGLLDSDPPSGYRQYSFTVKVVDEPNSVMQHSGYTTVTVIPIDANDNAPIWDANTLLGSVPEGAGSISSVFMTVIAMDYDSGNNGLVSYRGQTNSQSPSTPLNAFSVLSNGNISLAKELDREAQPKYVIGLIAEDNAATLKKSTPANATIYVLDINDNAPVFEKTSFQITIKETFVGDILTLKAADNDINDILIYSVSTADFKHFGMRKDGDVAHLYVHNSPDFDIGEVSFNVTVTVSDGKFSDTAEVYITVLDVNDNAPNFKSLVILNGGNFSENVAVNTEIATFTAIDIDSNNNKLFDFYIDPATNPYKNFKVVPTNTTSGKIVVASALDRELIPVFDLHLLAIDKGHPQQTGTALIQINLIDVNDSPPHLKDDTIYFPENAENLGAQTVYAEDPDLPENGPPFRLTKLPCELDAPSSCNYFDFTEVNVEASKGSKAMAVRPRVILDREDEPIFRVRIQLSDNGGNTGTSTLTIVITDENDNPNTDAQQNINVYNYKGLFSNVNVGLVGFADADGDDRSSKTFQMIGTHEFFRVSLAGEIMMLEKVGYTKHEFRVRVVDDKTRINGVLQSVTSTTSVAITVEELAEEAPYSSGSVRLSGITGAEFVSKKNGESPYEKFRNQLVTSLGKEKSQTSDVQIVSFNETGEFLDIRFAAHGSPYYSPSRMNGLVESNKAAFEGTLNGGKIEMVNIDLCQKESCEGGCYNELVVNPQPIVINSPSASAVGVDTYVVAKCGCRTPATQTECTPDYCYNEGECSKNYYGTLSCSCAEGFDGPRCQNTKLGFAGTGYALFKPLEQCNSWTFSMELATTTQAGLVFYSGPTTAVSVTDNEDFIALQLQEGYPTLLINLGSGTLALSVQGTNAVKLDDGNWHQIDIIKEGKFITLMVDRCKGSTGPDAGGAGDRSSCEASGFTPSVNEYLNVNSFLQLGSRMSTPSYPTGVSEAKFKGCMRNIRHKGELYDLSTKGKFTGVQDSCPAEDEVCSSSNTPKCGENGQCLVTNIGVPLNYECICNQGYRGPSDSSPCSTKTVIGDFKTESFMIWNMQTNFVKSLSPKTTDFSLNFRTRDRDGVLYHVLSEDLDFIRLLINDNVLELQYDLGDGQQTLRMEGVQTSDGQWHSVFVQRAGHFFIMKMDDGEGARYVTSAGTLGGYEDLANRGVTYAGAEVSFSSGSGLFSDFDLNSTCFNDIRMSKMWFPMRLSENNENTEVKLDKVAAVEYTNCARPGCSATYIALCTSQGKICVDLWEDYACVCGPGTIDNGAGGCKDLNYCESSPCYGQSTCVNATGGFQCQCPTGWRGKYCSEVASTAGPIGGDSTNNAGLIAGLVVAVIVILIIAFIVGFLLFRRCGGVDDSNTLIPDDKDDYEIRENIVAYDEEGAGEEDHEGYDLNRLRKPMDTMTRMSHPDLAASRDQFQGKPDFNSPGVKDFIGDRLQDADNDPNAPPFDTVLDLNYEGEGSVAGSLSSLNTSSSGGSQDYEYLNNWGPKFAKLADMYNDYSEVD